MNWSVHQYQTPRIGAPNRMPVQGKSGCDEGCHRSKRRPDGRDQRVPAADRLQAEDGHDDGADEQHEHLHRVRVEHGLQPAEERVYAGREHHDRSAGPEVDAHEGLEHDAARRDRDGYLRQHVADDGDDREVHARPRRVPPLEELRHREHAAAQVEGHEEPAEQQQHEPGHDLELGDREAGSGAGAREPDEVLRADVGSEQRRADDEPAGVASGEEVATRALPGPGAPRDDDCDHEGEHEIERHHHPVEHRHALPPVEKAPLPTATPPVFRGRPLSPLPLGVAVKRARQPAQDAIGPAESVLQRVLAAARRVVAAQSYFRRASGRAEDLDVLADPARRDLLRESAWP